MLVLDIMRRPSERQPSEGLYVCRAELLAALAACTLHHAAPSVPQQTMDLLLRALAKGTAAAAVELEASVEAAAAAVQEAVRQLPGMQHAVPSVAWGILQRLLAAPDEHDAPLSVKVCVHVCAWQWPVQSSIPLCSSASWCTACSRLTAIKASLDQTDHSTGS